MKSKNLEFKINNTKAFISWLKRFNQMNDTLLLEINFSNMSFSAKTYNEERSVVKSSSILFTDANFEVNSKTIPENYNNILVGIFSTSKLMKSLEHFTSDSIFSIQYNEMNSDTETKLVGEKIIIKNSSLTIEVVCTSIAIFVYISDEKFKNAIAYGDIVGSIDISKALIEKSLALNALDTDKKFMKIKILDNKGYISGKFYDLSVGDIQAKDLEVPIFKEQYSSLDNENYVLDICEDKLIFKSSESITTTVISPVIEN